MPNVIINNKAVEQVKSYKYLGCTIQQDLKWNVHVSEQVDKADKRMYFVRSLKKLHVDSKLISMFFNATVSSVITYAILCWFGSCTAQQKKDVSKCKRQVCKMISPDQVITISDPEVVYENKCNMMLRKILSDNSHPLHECIKILPHGRRLDSVYCRTKRFQSTFVPSAIHNFKLNV